jgi:PKHD-type hydroxylase
VLSPAQCRRVCALGGKGTGDEWWVEGDAPEIRRAWSSTIVAAHNTQWLFDRIDEMFSLVAHHYGFALGHTSPELLFVRYEVGDHFTWHSDLLNDNEYERKLSATILLAKTNDLAGGQLQFLHSKTGAAFKAGTAVVFPAFMAHRVTEVKAGTRTALVAWKLGPKFR